MLDTDWLSGCDHILRNNIACILATACPGEKIALALTGLRCTQFQTKRPIIFSILNRSDRLECL